MLIYFRSTLQTELTRLQNLVSIQADTLERVKVENSQLKHQLTDTQHKVRTWYSQVSYVALDTCQEVLCGMT